MLYVTSLKILILVVGFLGATLFASGIIIVDTFNEFDKEYSVKPDSYELLIAVVGFTTFISACLGYCGVQNESPFLLTTYSIVVTILVVPQIVIGVYSIESKEKWNAMVMEFLENEIQFERFKTNIAMRDKLQADFECCGRDGKDDYKGYDLPSSCCSPIIDNCTKDDAFNVGCLQVMSKEFNSYRTAIITNSFLSAVANIISSGLATFLVYIINRRNESMQ